MSAGRDLTRGYGPPLGLKKAYAPVRATPAPAVYTKQQAPAPAPSLPVGPTPNTEVYLDIQCMLRIASHCCENAPSVVTGELVGLETTPGRLEVSNCFVTPPRRDIWNPRERPDVRQLEEKHKREVEKYRSKVRELLHYVDADCQSVGWFQTMTHRAIAEPAAIDQLYQRMIEVDRASIILAFDLERNATGQFPFRAFHLSERYIQLRRKQEGGELQSGSALRTLSDAELLTELPVKTRSTVAMDYLLSQIPMNVEARAAADERSQMNAASQLEQGMQYLALALEEFTVESERLAKYQKDSSRFHQNLKRTIERKRNENEQRRLGGEEELHIEEEAALSNFEKRVEIPNQMKTLMMCKQVDSLADSVTQLAKRNVATSALIKSV